VRQLHAGAQRNLHEVRHVRHHHGVFVAGALRAHASTASFDQNGLPFKNGNPFLLEGEAVFERGPFQPCPRCQSPEGLGVLSAGGSAVNRRCRGCRFSFSEALPSVEKDVVYLDQHAISEIFKVKSETRRAGAQAEGFWRDVTRETTQAYLLQQVIFPISNLHQDETIVSPFAKELSLTHEMMSGDTSFIHINKIDLMQVLEFAKAYREGRPAPHLLHNVDEILDGNRNDWLADLHIDASADFSIFAERIRSKRDTDAEEFRPLYEKWAQDKPTFDQALRNEIGGHGNLKRDCLRYATQRSQKLFQSADPLDFERYAIFDEVRALENYFERAGASKSEIFREINTYWDWPGNEQIPNQRITAYLYAALARRMASGQKRLPSRGMANDIRAIAFYGPYVDAMFLDNECAQLLKEEPLRSEVKLKARIFSTRSGDSFLEYLHELQRRASPETKAFSKEIYGIDVR
jgi:hypothetical protein